MADDRVAAAVAELYGADPGAFTERRKALVAAAREAGDRAAAGAIAALRKPTRAAWVVNRLARSDPSAAGQLASLAGELRAAEAAKDGARLRELSAARGSLIDGLVVRALSAAGVPDPPSALRDEVVSTLTAALADPETAAGFAAGALTKAVQWSGFGYADFPATDGSTADGSDGRDAAVAPAPVDIPAHQSRQQADRAEPGSRAAPQRTARQRERQEREQRRRAEEDQRRAQEAAERAARAREKYEDAERTLAQASAAAAEAAAAEDRLEAEVRLLEERLTQAREELAAARLRARRAEAAERRARQAADRLK